MNDQSEGSIDVDELAKQGGDTDPSPTKEDSSKETSESSSVSEAEESESGGDTEGKESKETSSSDTPKDGGEVDTEGQIDPMVKELVDKNDAFELANEVLDLRHRNNRLRVQLERAKDQVSKLQSQVTGRR